MQYTENYQFRKPVIGIDVADVKDINFNSDRADTLIHNTQISLAPAYDLNETYDTGDVVMYETLMYKCKADNVTGAWDPSKWERTTAGEEGAGGGGTDVEANPTGTPTDTLDTIRIGQTIYDIVGSGGGGGGSTYRETLLYENTGTSAGNITLSDDLSNYDMLMFVVVRTIGVGRELIELPFMTSDLTIGTHITLISYASEYVNYDVTSMTLLTKTGSQSNYVEKVKGIKFGGGNGAGGGLERTLLWDYVTDNNNTIPYGTYTVSLNDDINNYDMLVMESVSSATDLTDPNWAATNLWYVDVNALNNNWNNNYITYTSWDNRATKFHIVNTTFEALNNNGSNTNGLVRVYGLKWTGGSGGDASNYTEVSLFTGTSRVTNMTLSESIKNFDAIEFQTAWIYNNLPYHISEIITSENLSADNYFVIGANSYRYAELLVVDNTHINWTGGSDNIMYMKEIKGIRYGGGGAGDASEIIPISTGDGTTSRTFTLNRTPKKVTLQGYTNGDGGWYESGYFVWGENFMNLYGAQRSVATGGYVGQAAISYGADGKSFTITATNAFGAFNRADNFTGMMLVEYGGGSGGSAVKDILYSDANGAPHQTDVALAHNIFDYDEVYFKVSNPTDIQAFNAYTHQVFMPMLYNSGERWGIQALYDQRVVEITFASDGLSFNIVRTAGDYQNNTVYEVIGIKH